MKCGDVKHFSVAGSSWISDCYIWGPIDPNVVHLLLMLTLPASGADNQLSLPWVVKVLDGQKVFLESPWSQDEKDPASAARWQWIGTDPCAVPI